MQQQLPSAYRLELALDRREREAREAALARLAPAGRPGRVRSAVGLSLVRLGARLAEPSLQPARQR